jgi:hypothetical protein
VRANLRINRPEPIGRSQNDLGTSPTADGQAPQGGKEVSDLAVGESAVLVEVDDGGLGIGSDLAGGRAEGIGGLQGMPALHRASALPATAALDAEASPPRPAGNLGLELFDDIGCFEIILAAVRASGRQRHRQRFVDLIGRGRRSMAVRAVGVTGLAAGRLRSCFGRPLGKGGGLTFAGALLGFEQAREVLDFRFEFGHALVEASAIGTGVGHGINLSSRRPLRSVAEAIIHQTSDEDAKQLQDILIWSKLR